MNNRIWTIFMWLAFIVLVVCIPIMFDNLIFKYNIMPDLTREQVFVFWGNYASAILRSIMSMLGVMLTIKYYINNDKKENHIRKLKENRLIEYYFEFLELLNELKKKIGEEEISKIEIMSIWKKCEEYYNYKVIIGIELEEFDKFQKYIENFIDNIEFIITDKGQAEESTTQCIEVLEVFYEISKRKLLG